MDSETDVKHKNEDDNKVNGGDDNKAEKERKTRIDLQLDLAKSSVNDDKLNPQKLNCLSLICSNPHNKKNHFSFDPNNKINQPSLFLDFLSKSKKLKSNYDKFAEEIVKMSFVKSKDKLADFLLKAIGFEKLKFIVQVRSR